VPTQPDRADLESLLAAIIQAGVECIVVGGAAAVLHGAPITTQDLDIVQSRDPENLARLTALLAKLDARVRDAAGRDLPMDPDALRGTSQVRLSTNQGPLDVLGALHDGRTYDDLLAHTVEFTEGSLRVRVIDLPTLIEIKSGTGRARDKLVLPILMALSRDCESGDEA